MNLSSLAVSQSPMKTWSMTCERPLPTDAVLGNDCEGSDAPAATALRKRQHLSHLLTNFAVGGLPYRHGKLSGAAALRSKFLESMFSMARGLSQVALYRISMARGLSQVALYRTSPSRTR